jgi:phenylalanine-4-hydroxylase
VLFAADSFAQMVDVVGGFFAECDDDTPARLGVKDAVADH